MNNSVSFGGKKSLMKSSSVQSVSKMVLTMNHVHFTSHWPHEVTAIPFPPAAWSHRIRLGVSHPDPSRT